MLFEMLSFAANRGILVNGRSPTASSPGTHWTMTRQKLLRVDLQPHSSIGRMQLQLEASNFLIHQPHLYYIQCSISILKKHAIALEAILLVV